MRAFLSVGRNSLAVAAAVAVLGLTGATHGAVYNSDGDFDRQTNGSTIGSPWSPAGGLAAAASAQSPFLNVYANNGKGSTVGASAANPFYVNFFTPIAATSTAPLYFNVDFRNTTNAESGDYSLTIGQGADGSKLTAALFISGSAAYARSGAGIGTSLLNPELNTWYNAQLTLDMATNTYSGVITREGSFAQTAISGRSFITENAINHIYTDGSTNAVGGAAPGHDLDNWALSSTPIRAADQVRVAPTNFVNVDFNGKRDNDALGATYQGVSRGGGVGTYFNSVEVDARPGNVGSTNDNFTITSGALLDSNSLPTTVSVQFKDISGDNNGAGAAGLSTSSAALFNDYLFNNSATNNGGGDNISEFTISGLTPNTYVDIYFYHGAGGAVIEGTGGATLSADGVYTTANVNIYRDVWVMPDGTVVGTLPAGTNVINGLSVGYSVPEPASLSLLLAGGLGLLARRRRN